MGKDFVSLQRKDLAVFLSVVYGEENPFQTCISWVIYTYCAFTESDLECKIVIFYFLHRQNYMIIKLQRFYSVSEAEFWCFTICRIVLLDFARIIKLHCFGSLILLPSSGRKGGKRTERLLPRPPVELASDLDQVNQRAQQIGFLSSSPVFYLKTEAETL
jgi:hypothetical protein